MKYKTNSIEIKEALDFFWLSIPVKDKSEIKKTFKKLSMIHHPDRWWKSSDFIKLKKYKDLLEKNFYLINERNVNLKEEIENLEKQESKQQQNQNQSTLLLKTKIKKFKLSFLLKFFYLIDIILYYILYTFWALRVASLIILVHILLFLIPFVFFSKITEKIEPNFKQEWYITDWVNIRHYKDEFITDLWQYMTDYEKHNKKIYWIEKLEEREKLLIELFLKITSIYLIILSIFSIIYYLLIKKNLYKIFDYVESRLNLWIWKIRIKFDIWIIKENCFLKDTEWYRDILYFLKITQIYYFTLLYIFVYFITYFIYLIF